MTKLSHGLLNVAEERAALNLRSRDGALYYTRSSRPCVRECPRHELDGPWVVT